MQYDPVLPAESFVNKHDLRLGGHTQRTLVSLNDPKNYIAIVDLLKTGIPVIYFALRQDPTRQSNMILELPNKAYQYVVQNAIDIIRWAFNQMQKPKSICQGTC